MNLFQISIALNTTFCLLTSSLTFGVKVKYFMFIKYGFCVFKKVTFVFHVFIIRTNVK